MAPSCFLPAQVTHLECCFNGSACYFSGNLAALSSLSISFKPWNRSVVGVLSVAFEYDQQQISVFLIVWLIRWRLNWMFFFQWFDSPLEAWATSLFEASRSHTLDTPHSVGLLRTRDQLDAETSTWQHPTLTRDRHPCPRWDSNPQS
jgi:hypothetical protein